MKGRPKKRRIELEAVSSFLKGKDFQVSEIDQEWRHVVARGVYRGRRAVFKLASTQKTAEMTQNEFYWNEAIYQIHESQRKDFIVPKNLDSGFYSRLFYFIAGEFNNKLIERDSKNTKRIEKNLKQIAKAACEIRNLRIPANSIFYKRQASKEYNAGKKLLESSLFWSAKIDLDLSKFIKIIEERKDDIRTSPGHGDFVPRQLYYVNGKIGIIDGEHAGILGPLYYDPAWFYLRLRIDHNTSDLGENFLKEYKKLLGKNDQNIFWKELKPVLTQRFIGEVWGSGKKSNKKEKIFKLGQDILNDNVI